ncbi:MAG: glutathione S-transferase [Paracoccaceae bacterium]|jgi:glutathione S-transferase
MGMTTPYRLHYAPDNASLIIRLVLEELGVPYTTTLVDRTTGQQRSPAYRALNPNGLTPVLETPQGPIFETGAILLWLTDTHHALAPQADHPDRATFLKWLFFVSNTLHAEMGILFYPTKYVGPDSPAHASLRQTLHSRLTTHVSYLEGMVTQNPETSIVLSYYIACLLRWMALYPRDTDHSWFELTGSPNLHSLLATLETRPAVHTAEGLGPTPFTAPTFATPPEGSTT